MAKIEKQIFKGYILIHWSKFRYFHTNVHNALVICNHSPQSQQGTKIFQYCTCPAGQVANSFHLSCKHKHLSFKSVCNKEHKRVICYMTSSSNSSQSTRPTGRVLGKNYLSFLDLTRNYKWTSGIFVPCSGNSKDSDFCLAIPCYNPHTAGTASW